MRPADSRSGGSGGSGEPRGAFRSRRRVGGQQVDLAGRLAGSLAESPGLWRADERSDLVDPNCALLPPPARLDWSEAGRSLALILPRWPLVSRRPSAAASPTESGANRLAGLPAGCARLELRDDRCGAARAPRSLGATGGSPAARSAGELVWRAASAQRLMSAVCFNENRRAHHDRRKGFARSR